MGIFRKKKKLQEYEYKKMLILAATQLLPMLRKGATITFYLLDGTVHFNVEGITIEGEAHGS